MIEPRKTVREIRAYAPPLEGRRGQVRLDFNENTAGTGWGTEGLPADEVACYPEYGRFREELARELGLPAERLLITNGTGEALHLIAFAFIEPGVDAALTSAPTFALIPHSLKLVGARLAEVPATADFRFDLDAIGRELDRGIKLAVLASPDNPTGATLAPAQIRAWCEGHPETLFAIDEAYAEYGSASALPLAGELPNLLVLRTFSKAWGMAGLRLGLVAGDARLIEILLRVRAPYSVNCAAMRAATALLPRRAEVEAEAKRLAQRRPALLAAFAERGFATHAAGGNFFLVMAGLDAAPLAASLREGGVLVRDQSAKLGMRGIVRITVGTEGENRQLLEAVDRFRGRRAVIFDLDDTLVDTSKSYDAAIAELVARNAGEPLPPQELSALRREGGFNDDWESARELLRRRGVDVPLEELAEEGKAIYLPLARGQERLLVDAELLRRLARRLRLFIFTGRTRGEYEPIWGKELGPLFEAAYCKDDFDGCPAKPAPDMLREIQRRAGIDGGYYVGNSVDDMRSAKAAGLSAIGVATTCPADLLAEAGADEVIETAGGVRGAFLL